MFVTFWLSGTSPSPRPDFGAGLGQGILMDTFARSLCTLVPGGDIIGRDAIVLEGMLAQNEKMSGWMPSGTTGVRAIHRTEARPRPKRALDLHLTCTSCDRLHPTWRVGQTAPRSLDGQQVTTEQSSTRRFSPIRPLHAQHLGTEFRT